MSAVTGPLTNIREGNWRPKLTQAYTHNNRLKYNNQTMKIGKQHILEHTISKMTNLLHEQTLLWTDAQRSFDNIALLWSYRFSLTVAATGDGSNFVRISYWVFVILAPGHQGSHLKCMLFSGGYFFCEFPVCVLLRLSARVFVSGAGFWTGWTCFLCEVDI